MEMALKPALWGLGLMLLSSAVVIKTGLSKIALFLDLQSFPMSLYNFFLLS